MPTYVVTTRTGLLDDSQRAAIAVEISAAHQSATGAPAYLAQVIFDEKEPSRCFLGGRSCDSHIWVRGDIRAGRTPAQRTGLIQAIAKSVAVIAGTSETEVWVYVCELAPTDMIEYGHVLPSPGEEKAWFASLPPALRSYLAGLG